MVNVDSQHRHLAKLQRSWAANARRDQQYNMKRAMLERKAGNLTLARGYEQEARWDQFWMLRRLRIAKKESR